MRLAVTAGLTVALLTLGVATPSGGQELGEPEFGPLVITPDEGAAGDLVVGHVDTNVVAERCATDPNAIREQFNIGGTPASYLAPGPVYQAYLGHGPLIGIEPDPNNPFPDQISDLGYAWFLLQGGGTAPDFNQDLNAARLLWVLMDSIGSSTWPDELFVDPYLAATFILTFADINTQSPIGDISNFDRFTGIGQVNVPDIAPGPSAVAATCVEPVITDASFLAAIDAGAAFLEANDVPLDANAVTYGGEGWLLENIGLVMLPELMQPQAGPWVALFCVGGWDVACATEPPPTPTPGPAAPVETVVRFTG